jgi:hypothetical protein
MPKGDANYQVISSLRFARWLAVAFLLVQFAISWVAPSFACHIV